MKVKFENFAKAGNGTISINDLTVICGPNNTGKTYINYAIYSVLSNLGAYFDIGMSDNEILSVIQNLEKNQSSMVEIGDPKSRIRHWILDFEQKFVKYLHYFFSLPESDFANTKISLEFDEVEFNNFQEFNYTRYGFLFSGRYSNRENQHAIVISMNDLDNGKYFFDLSDMEKIRFIKSFINVTILRTFFYNVRLPFPITSERTGISLFHKLFDRKSDEFNDELTSELNYEPIEFNKIYSKVVEKRSKHALPIQHNINLFRDIEETLAGTSMFSKHPEKNKGLFEILAILLDGGEFKVKDNGILMYCPSNDSNASEPMIPLHAASSSVKSLFLFDVFIKHVANDRHILIIDEPELNLFLVNQVLIARLIARLVNSGIKVVITTHSDFLIRELNNLITLSEVNDDNPEKEIVINSNEYNRQEILSRDQVRAYMTTDKFEIQEIDINKFGIGTELMDSVINNENKKSRRVSFLIEDDE